MYEEQDKKKQVAVGFGLEVSGLGLGAGGLAVVNPVLVFPSSQVNWQRKNLVVVSGSIHWSVLAVLN